MSAQASYRGGLARIALAGVVWGSIPLLVRQVHTGSYVIVFWRVIFAGSVMLGYLLWRGRLGELRALPHRKKLALIGMGALLALNWVLFFTALQLTEVAVAVLLGYCGPVFVTAFGPLVTREPFDRRVLAPLALALGGTALIVGPQQLRFGDSAHLLGATLAFCSAITYSVLVLNAKRLISDVPMSVYMLAEDLTAALVLLPFVLAARGPQGAVEWGSLAVLGIVHTALTGFLFLSGLRAVRADHGAILTYAEPVSAVVFATLFLAEPLMWTTVLGGFAVVLGGVLVARMEPVAGIEAPVPVMETDAV